MKELEKDLAKRKARLQSVIGLIVFLFSVSLLIGQVPMVQISFPFFYFFGFYHYVVFTLLALLGLYIVLSPRIKEQHRINFKNFPMQLSGFFLALFSFLILIGALAPSEQMTLSNFATTYNDYWWSPTRYDMVQPINIFSLGDGDALGGFLGSFLSALFAFGTKLSYLPIIVFGAFLVVGLTLLFLKPTIVLAKYIKLVIAKRKKKDIEYEEISSGDPKDYRPSQETEANSTLTSVTMSETVEIYDDEEVGETHGMARARFGSSGIVSNNNEEAVIEHQVVYEEAIQMPIEEKTLDIAEEEVRVESPMRPTPTPVISHESISKSEPIIVKTTNVMKEAILIAKKRKRYIYPGIDLLETPQPDKNYELNVELANRRVEDLNRIFEDLSVGARAVSYQIGPAVTRYDIQYDSRSKANAVRGIIPDIAIRLGGVAARFEEVVFGKTTSGIEVQNARTSKVWFKDTFQRIGNDPKMKLAVPFGKDIEGEVKFAPLNEFPHMLVAGTTGSGKSVFVHALIMTLIMRNSPEDLRLVLIDPKRVEMTKYRAISHLLCPIITEPKEAKVAIDKLVEEMEERYITFGKNDVNSIITYNKSIEGTGLPKMPYIILVVDEFADLMDSSKGAIESGVKRLGQKSRAAGIHMVIATQRPSVKVITGEIKANINTRVALATANSVDSQTIIGLGGAEQLLGYGDMLVDSSVLSRYGLVRLQGCYVSDDEMRSVCNFIRQQGEPDYDEKFMDLRSEEEIFNASAVSNSGGGDLSEFSSDSERYERIVEHTFSREYVSMSHIQTAFAPCGFNTARKYIYRLQKEGIIEANASNPSKGFKVLIKSEAERQRNNATSNADDIPGSEDYEE